MSKKIVLVFYLLCFTNFLLSQTYSIVIKDGHVIDPKNNIDAVMDIAINDGKIVLVTKNIDSRKATQVVNAKGLYVTPGLIDIHTHNFVGTNLDNAYSNGPSGVIPDGFTFRTGVTTVVDAGSSGWRTFPEFKKNIIILIRGFRQDLRVSGFHQVYKILARMPMNTVGIQEKSRMVTRQVLL